MRIFARQLVGSFYLIWSLVSPAGAPAATTPGKPIAIPMTFERNDGQTSSQYRFLSRHQGVQALFSAKGPDFVVRGKNFGSRRLEMRFLAAAGSPEIDGERPLSGRANYLHGKQAEKWVTAIPTFGQVRYADLYPGIDLVFHPDKLGSELEHDFLLAPGANPASIQFQMRGADEVRLGAGGQLMIEVQGKALTFHLPSAYQETRKGRVPVKAEFCVNAQGVIGFHLGKYDHRNLLTIDPVLSFATYLDGTMNDGVRGMVTDATGNIYLAGSTTSSDFPSTNAEQASNKGQGDAFVAKLDPSGHTLIYSTYLGGSDTDEAESVAVDSSGNVVVSGTSQSTDFPQAGALTITRTGYMETFVASLNATGTVLRYSGFLAANDPVQESADLRLSRVALDTQGNAYVAGLTNDPSFTITPGAYGGAVAGYPADPTLFLAKVQLDGSFAYKATIPQTPPQTISSYVLPPSIGNIAIDPSGALILAGSAGNDVPTTAGTLSPAFPNSLLPDNASAGFALKLNAAGTALVFSTYLPGTNFVNDLALDAAGDIYLTGGTVEATLPVGQNAFQKTLVPSPNGSEGFIFKLGADGTTAVAATYIEGAQSSAVTDVGGVVVDPAGNVDIAGRSGAADLPTKNPLLSVINLNGLGLAGDLFVAQLSADLSTLQFATFLHASDQSSHWEALAAAPSNRILVASGTYSNIFPTTAGSFQPVPPPPTSSQLGYPEIVIVGIDVPIPAPSLCFDTTSVNFGAVLVNTVANATVNVTNCGNAPLSLSSITSSDTTVTATQNCTGIAPAAACQLQLAYAPTAVGGVQGSLMLSGNNAISPQTVAFTGTSGYPQVTLPPSLSFDDLLVGETGSVNVFTLFNQGGGAFILTSAVVTGDFQVTQNSCNVPVPVNSFCFIAINFSPTAVGPRTGVLTLTDNLNPTVQTIQVSGNGLSVAPAPTITQIPATPVAASGLDALTVVGTGFFPNSTVTWNGQTRTTHYVGETELIVDLLPADIQQVGEAKVVVTTPAPGGGSSAAATATVYGRLQNIQILNEVFEPHSQLIYATVSKTSQTNANSVVAIDPVAMKVVNTVLTGSSPDSIAVSDDGSMLYVSLDDLLSVTQISLPGGTQNFTLPLPAVTLNSAAGDIYTNVLASALKVVPGQPHTWLAGLCLSQGTPCGLGVAVFDDAVVRPTQELDAQLTANSFVFVSDPTVVYSTEFNQLPPDISAYKISSSGITRTALSAFLPSVGGSLLESDGHFIYDSTGQVIDPSTLVTTSTYPQAATGSSTPTGFHLDTAGKRLYFAGALPQNPTNPFGSMLLSAVDQTTMSTIGQIQFPEEATVDGIERFGANGLAINQGNQWLFLETSLTGTLLGSQSVTVSPTSLSFAAQIESTTSASQTVTLANNGTSALVINGITTTGDYGQTNNCAPSLAIFSSCVISVTFTPTATGDRMGQLIITDNGDGSPQAVALDGTGTSAAPVLTVTVSPASLAFGSQMQGTPSSPQSVTLKNTGTAAISISGITATGDYTQTNQCGTSLPVSASCVVSVIFTPGAAGDRTGQLMIADNAAGSPQTVSLDGTGTAAAPPINLLPQTSGGSSATVTAGATATYHLVLMTSAYTGAVGLTCTGAPALATCSINPASPNVTAGAPTPLVVTVTTASSNSSKLSDPAGPGDKQERIASAGLGLLTLLSLPLILAIRLNRNRVSQILLLVFAIGWGIVGCGSGSPSKSAAQPTTLAVGTYQITIAASANNQSTTEVLTLIVQ